MVLLGQVGIQGVLLNFGSRLFQLVVVFSLETGMAETYDHRQPDRQCGYPMPDVTNTIYEVGKTRETDNDVINRNTGQSNTENHVPGECNLFLTNVLYIEDGSTKTTRDYLLH